MELPAEFLAKMQNLLKEDYNAFLASYNRPAERGIRVNTLKIPVDKFKKLCPFELEEVKWEQSGFYASGEKPGKTIYHAAGLYYVQEPSAMCAVPQLDVAGAERVLDLCSAPGGKGTQIAQYMNGDGLLVLNEINFSRAKILSSNVERMGVKNAVVTCATPQKLSLIFDSYFDRILVDAPCSGEGMFKKEEAAVSEWSPENVAMCAARQAEILDCAYNMLSGGGKMVYSTCTFSPEEDELQIQNFAKTHKCTLLTSKKLYPHEIRGEGHFYAVIQKSEGERRNIPLLKPFIKDKNALKAYREWEEQTLNIKLANLHLSGTTLYSLPDGMPDLPVQILRSGIRLGEYSGRFEPSHSLAMCLKNDEAKCIEVDEATAINYLMGRTFNCDAGIKGWRVVTFNGYPLGWCKCTGGTAKNHLPKGIRINT